MHKKLAADLMSLAHGILQIKNKEDVFLLQEKSKEIYEKLSVLTFVEEYVNTTPNLIESKEDLISTVELAFAKKEIAATKSVKEIKVETVVHQLEEEVSEEITTEITEQPFDELEELIFANTDIKNDVKDVGDQKTTSLEEELKDTFSVDIMADLFETVKPKSLNDALQTNIQIGLNDRIAFVKNLFNGSQEDYNRVVSQLNTFKTEKEAKKFVTKMVKPDYNWSEHEELEIRFLEIIERKFI